jgi:hypothetical protein
MDAGPNKRPPVPGSVTQGQALPSIASLTSALTPAESSPVRLRHQSEACDARDSGNWSISQSKRESSYYLSPACVAHVLLLTRAPDSSTISNNMGLQLQTLLNPEDSPSRHSVPDTPSSSRYPSGLQQVRLYSMWAKTHSDTLPECSPIAQPGLRQPP